jgi:hypothetical protein
MLFALFCVGGTAIASAQYSPNGQYSPRYWIVLHPSFQERQAAVAAGTFAPDRVIAGPYDTYSDCAADIHIYRGQDYQHIYSCEIKS